MLALLAREAHAERLFERLARGRQSRQVALLGAGPRLARVGGEEPGEVLRRGDLRLAQQAAPQELAEALTVFRQPVRGIAASVQKPTSVAASE